MFLKKLSLVNFKNYGQVDIQLSPKLNCFVGNNGVGKTNLLDAIYYLSFCKSFINAADSQNIKYSENFFLIQGDYEIENETDNIFCGFKKGAKKQFKRNKKEYAKLSEHIGLLPLVIVSPNDNQLILSGSEERRKFIDGVISQYDKEYLNFLISYNHALLQRNAILKDIGRKGLLNRDVLDIWNQQLIRFGKPIYKKRKEFITNLIPVFQEFYDFIASSNEKVALLYSSALDNEPFEDILKKSEEKDFILQYTSAGIHRDDLDFFIGEHSLKKTASQGQQKTYLVALKFAQFEFIKKTYGYKPLLLLDDIFDKLDQLRMKQILKLVADHKFGQIFITDTGKRIEQIIENVADEYKLFNVKDESIFEFYT